ncbi:MAG: molecular chaperone HtpG [Eubacteriales bacterium]|nr:molecular chaperone HtpG [Eubacteriales bacterium]
MNKESGNVSISTENIFPIIKKWLYSDKDIFLRELVSNSCDAISKYKKLVTIGEAEAAADGTDEQSYRIDVHVDKKKKILKVSDNGIGMNAEEVRKYINQIAFSGMMDFVEKYKDKADGSQIIGHFGLGFYSVFMVADKVVIDTLSYMPGLEAVKWTSKDGTEYELTGSGRKVRGTEITVYVDDESKEFLDAHKIREVLRKYCAFMPYEIYFTDADEIEEEKKRKAERIKEEKEKAKETDKETKEAKDADKEDRKAKEAAGEKGKDKAADDAPKPVNDTKPLWLKDPKDCTDEEYKDFYSKVFMDFSEPLFWIHLNVDYPFNLKGILYFPRLKNEFQSYEGQIKLFYNQVFVADNIKEIIPEFLLLLKGMIDCPDLPLNVSRSFLQNDGYVRKISSHIIKKVADKLISLYDNERENYNKYWEDINPFVKYGCMREEKFYDRVKDILIFKTIRSEYLNLKEYLEKNSVKNKNTVYYVTDEKQQAQYIKIFRDHDMEAVILPALIDVNFVSFLEMKDSKVRFMRIDSDLSESLKETAEGDDADQIKENAGLLEKLFRDASGNEKLEIKIESLKTDSVPGIILLSEQSRRMQEMSRMFRGGGFGDMPVDETLVLNSRNPLIRLLVTMSKSNENTEVKDDAGLEGGRDDLMLICSHIYDLAMLSHKQLEPETMTKFIERSNLVLEKFAGRLAK